MDGSISRVCSRFVCLLASSSDVRNTRSKARLEQATPKATASINNESEAAPTGSVSRRAHARGRTLSTPRVEDPVTDAPANEPETSTTKLASQKESEPTVRVASRLSARSLEVLQRAEGQYEPGQAVVSTVIRRHVSSTTPAVQNDMPSSFEHKAAGSSGAENGQHAPPDSAALTAPVDCHAAHAIATASALSESRPRMRFDSDASNDELDAYIDRLTSGGSVDMDALIDPVELRRVGRYGRLGSGHICRHRSRPGSLCAGALGPSARLSLAGPAEVAAPVHARAAVA